MKVFCTHCFILDDIAAALRPAKLYRPAGRRSSDITVLVDHADDSDSDTRYSAAAFANTSYWGYRGYRE